MRTKKQFFFIWFQYYSSIKPHKQHYYINRKNMEEFIYPTSCNRPFLFVKNWRTVFWVLISIWLISPTSYPAKQMDGEVSLVWSQASAAKYSHSKFHSLHCSSLRSSSLSYFINRQLLYPHLKSFSDVMWTLEWTITKQKVLNVSNQFQLRTSSG